MTEKEFRIRCGYACINLSIDLRFKSYRLKTVLDKDWNKVYSVIGNNLGMLPYLIKNNISRNIYVYRFSSDLIPLISHDSFKEFLTSTSIFNDYQYVFDEIAELKRKYSLRLSLHPGIFTVLDSKNEDTRKKSLSDYLMQQAIGSYLGVDNIVLHLGGLYNRSKQEALDSFIRRLMGYKDLIDFNKLTLENDDKIFTPKDVIYCTKRLGCKWVYDFHHWNCNPCEDIINILRNNPPDKFHISSGVNGEFKPPHDTYVHKETLINFREQLTLAGIYTGDVIFETKLKDLALQESMKPEGNGYWSIIE